MPILGEAQVYAWAKEAFASSLSKTSVAGWKRSRSGSSPMNSLWRETVKLATAAEIVPGNRITTNFPG